MKTDNSATPHLPISAICQRKIVACDITESLDDAVALMAERGIGSVIVTDNKQPVGILGIRDATDYYLHYPLDTTLESLMTRDILRVSGTMEIDELSVELARQELRHALVVDDEGQMIGIVSESDIVNHQGVEHDLFLRSVDSIAPRQSQKFGQDIALAMAIERLHQVGQSAAIVVDASEQCLILTETDVIRALARHVDPQQPISGLELPKLVSVDRNVSLFAARQIFIEHGFRHLGIIDDDGSVNRLISYSDILRGVEYTYVSRLRTLLDTRDRALQQSMHNLRLIEKVINSSLEGVLITDSSGRIQSINPAFTSITGYTEADVIGRNPNILNSGRHDPEFYSTMWQSLRENGRWQGEIWNRTKGGHIYPEWLSINAITDERGNITQYAAVFHDLTESKRSEAMIRQMAHFDEMTRLANRRLFSDRLKMAVRYAQETDGQLAVIVIDIDVFKSINDRFGHTGGDEVLRTLAGRLSKLLSPADTAARRGGDEFALLLNDIDEKHLLERLDYVRQLVGSPVLVAHTEVRLTASIGAAMYPRDGKTVEDLINSAETAMQQAKLDGRNNYRLFSSELHDQHQQRHLISNYLHQAVANQELRLVYQPKLDLDSQRIIGVEALLRWTNAELGAVSPEQFIPLAEDSGVIYEISDWVLEEATRQARRWVDKGMPLSVAVNLSARQFHRGDVVADVSDAVHQFHLDPQWLSVELTETSFLNSAEATLKALQELRARGVAVSIDDFGTGYSSLSYIRTLSLDHLKIDKSFIASIDQSERDRQLVSAMIAMSQALGLTVIAEGVETLQQLKILSDLGCDQVQGYFISRPKSAADLERWLADFDYQTLIQEH